MADEYADARWDDRRAAYNLMPLTGLFPRRYDVPPRQGAVDLLLEGADSSREVVEITSTLDPDYQLRRQHTEALVSAVSGLYPGPRSWHFSFREGWWDVIAAQHRERRQLHRAIADELIALDAKAATAGEFALAPWINAVVVDDGEVGVHATGWSAGVRDSGQPYLERLTDFLSTSDLVAAKIRKLVEHAALLDASRTHLYLLMGSTGKTGNLLPWSPALLTEGRFRSPSGITDLWLDGGTNEVYHWTDLDGWVFHRTR